MRRFEARPSVAGLMILCLLTLALSAMFCFCIASQVLRLKVAGWIGVAAVGAGLVTLPRAVLVAWRRRIVMDDSGIHTGSPAGLVDWPDVVALQAHEDLGMLGVLVDDADKYLDRMSPADREVVEVNRQIGLPEIALRFAGLTRGVAEACRYLEERGYRVEVVHEEADDEPSRQECLAPIPESGADDDAAR